MRLLFILLMLLLPVRALAQDAEDKGFLTELLQDSLGGEGRVVSINGFAGALSRRATIASMTIADMDGVWLTLEDVALQWNRAGLLRGRIEIEELSAARIALPRMPLPAPGAGPSAEAQGFSLPELPVSIRIGTLSVAQIDLGAPILGQAAQLELSGAANLSDGTGAVTLNAARSDGQIGVLDLAGSYDGALIDLDLTLEEEPGGIAARLANLPGLPSVALTLKGSGPPNDFTTDLRLSTDGAPRLEGALAVTQEEADRRFLVDLGGDVTALFAPQYRAFFGEAVQLKASGVRRADGRTELEKFELTAAALELSGLAALDAENWPELLDIAGRLRANDGRSVLLPLGQTETRVDEAVLDIQFDASAGNALTGRFDLTGFDRDEVQVGLLTLDVDGTLAAASNRLNALKAAVTLSADAVEFSDEALHKAVGSRLTGKLDVDFLESGALEMTSIDLAGPDYGLTGNVALSGLEEAFDAALDLSIVAEDLSRFSDLSGQPLTGEATLQLTGSADLGGAFDLLLDGQASGITLGIAQADALLAGQTDLVVKAKRTEAGLVLETFDLRNPQASASGGGTVATDASNLQIDARITEVADLVPQFQGPLTVSGQALQDMRGWSVNVTAAGPLDAEAAIKGLATGPDASLDFDLAIPDIRRLASGYRGRLALRGNVAQSPEGWRVDTDVQGPYALSAELSGLVTGAAPDLRFNARLPNIAPLVPELSGPLRVDGTARQQGANWFVDTALNGPAGTTADVVGRVGTNGQLGISVAGNAPLALANPFIAPRNLQGQARFDLRVDGPAALRSVSGRVTAQNGRLIAPNFRVALSELAGQIDLSGGRADLALQSAVSTGGRLSVAGPVTLTGGFPTDLAIGIEAVRVTDPALYETVLNGQISVTGPLTGGARIAGRVDVGETNVSVPSSGLGGFTIIPEIVHQGASPAVRATQRRAGLDKKAQTASGSGPAYPLDVLISAPARIFVRGRGVDAELGGRLRLTGTTANILSSGQFSLIRGRLDILEKRFTLDEGSVQLQGGFDPFLRFVATTRTSTGTAGVIIEGAASSPQVRFISTPEAPQDEVLAQIFFGKDVAQLSAFQALQLANAVATLAGRGGEGVVSKLRKSFALDDLDVTTDESGNTAVRAGKYISENVYTDVELGGENGAELSINIDLTPNLTARGKADAAGGTSVGIYFEKDY